jgi:protein-L-isoaspartate(D-aspartate) O-methyltransferase
MSEAATSRSPARDLRARLADELVADGAITLPEVEAAIRAVPREAFTAEGIELAAAYANEVVITKRDTAGRTISSVSAPWLQAQMIEQVDLRPGAHVLEIGSGGYNAALIAAVQAPDGAVTSIDIDAEVVDQARTALRRSGYGLVQAVQADGEFGYPTNAPSHATL